MQTNGQFAAPPPADVPPPQYNPVNNNLTLSSNNSSRATSTPGSNQSLGHMLFNLSNQDVSLSPSSLTFPTNPSPAHGHPNLPAASLGIAAPCDATAGSKLVQDAATHQHLNANHQFSNFLLAPASSSLGHFPRREDVSMDSSPAENLRVHQPQQQIVQENSTSSVPLVNSNAHTLAPTSTLAASPVQAHTPAIPPHVHEVLGSGSVHISGQVNLENGEGLKQASEAMKLHHQQQQQLTLGLDKAMNLPASNTNLREMQVIKAELMSVGDVDQADEGACAGNRWPRQETIALLKIRADMDAAFRDTSVKRPLWDDVSRYILTHSRLHIGIFPSTWNQW
ncbi:hypothetical protein L7F22_004728 [Adiantum nelumboides]|nr:hypothetical protein [Adiantum nelumboides]